MAISRKDVWPNRLPRATAPITYLTENGFSIVRLSEIDPAVTDSPEECRFLVQDESETKHEIRVHFDEKLIASLQIRRTTPLSQTSTLWVVCAESCLANYLWEQNEFPPNGELIVTDFSPDQLMLALHWHDQDADHERD